MAMPVGPSPTPFNDSGACTPGPHDPREVAEGVEHRLRAPGALAGESLTPKRKGIEGVMCVGR